MAERQAPRRAPRTRGAQPPQRHRGAFPDRNGRAAALGSELAADPGSWGRPDGSKRTASFAERVRVYRAGGDCGTITFWPIPRFRPHLVVAHTLARAERAALQDPGPREADEQRARGVRGRLPRRDQPLRCAEDAPRSGGGGPGRRTTRILTRVLVESILVNRSAGRGATPTRLAGVPQSTRSHIGPAAACSSRPDVSSSTPTIAGRSA